MAVRVPDLELQLILHVAERREKNKTKYTSPPHTHIHTPFITLLGSLEISLGAYFSAYTPLLSYGIWALLKSKLEYLGRKIQP